MHKVITAIVAATFFISPAFADDGGGGDYGRDFYRDSGGDHFHPAPGPIAGASLPVLAVGFGVYWLVRRRRKT
jgi:hypothetical protein